MTPPTPDDQLPPSEPTLTHRRSTLPADDPSAPPLPSETWLRRMPRPWSPRTPKLSPSAQDSAQDITHRRSPLPADEPASPRTRFIKPFAIAFSVLAILLVIVAFIAAITLRHDLHASLPQNEGLLDGTAALPGLSSPVTVTRDPQGVPSIHASTLDDLLFAQGYITASDRLFQMDALRRHGAGELAEILGPSLLDHDRQQRILQLRAAADRAIAILPPDQLHQLQVYANGVNAFINSHNGTHSANKLSPSAQDSAQDLPVEFHILHYTPVPWTPRDSLLIAIVMSQDLSTSFPTKLNREALSAHLPASLLADLYPVGSWRDHPPTQTTNDLTTPSAPIEQIPLDRTQSSLTPNHGCPIHAPSSHEWVDDNSPCLTPEPPTTTSQLSLSAQDLSPSPQDSAKDMVAVSNALRAGLNIINDPTPSALAGLPGSNNWAVSGDHTSTGAPLLSNDMHLGLTAPDIWYEAGLHADGPNPLNVTGFTLPGVPFVIVGRNPFVAWAFTNSGADVQDLLIEHLRGSGNNTEFEHPDHTWSPVGHQAEHIRVRGSREVTLDVLTTTHTLGDTQSAGGTKTIVTPIISPLYKSEHRALALLWTVYDPSTITSPMYAINTATDAASLVAAFAGFGSVSQNLVYADAHHIGYHLLGRIPIRGPATQRPRAIQPFILPDTTPSEDEDDESGDPQTSSTQPPSAPSSTQPTSAASSTQPTSAPSSTRPTSAPSSTRGFTARQGGLSFAVANDRTPPPRQTTSARPNPEPIQRTPDNSPHLALASYTPNPSSSHHPTQPSPSRHHSVILSEAQRSRRTPKHPATPIPTTPSPSSTAQTIPTAPTTAYTIGSPISPVPVDALDASQLWSGGYIPYDALPSVLDPPSGILATANARIVTDDYPYFIANDWVDAYRVERINHLLTTDIADHTHLTSADMLAIQTDTHSEFDLLAAQRLAYALDHSPLTKKDPRLQQAANLLRDWTGDVSPNSSAAAIVTSTRHVLWPMLLIPKLRAQARATGLLKPSATAKDHLSTADIVDLTGLYSWNEKTTALEQILQHTPARWLPRAYPNWDDFLAAAVQRGLTLDHAPSNLSTWTYGTLHPVDIAHPVFGSHSLVSTLLGVPTGSGLHPNGGDGTTIKQTGLHFGPSERFTADLSNPDNTHANITTGESGNPASPWFLDQFLPWLNGTTFLLPLDTPPTTHTLTLLPK